MKTLLATALATLLLSIPAAADEASRHLASVRAAVDEMERDMEAILAGLLRSAPPIDLLGECARYSRVMQDSKAMSMDAVDLRRTSLTYHNPADAPDPWEAARLAEFAARAEAGAAAPGLEAWTTVEAGGGARLFRYMRAVPLRPPCDQCHGPAIAAEIAAALARAYPAAAAAPPHPRLIGAYSVRQPM